MPLGLGLEVPLTRNRCTKARPDLWHSRALTLVAEAFRVLDIVMSGLDSQPEGRSVFSFQEVEQAAMLS